MVAALQMAVVASPFAQFGGAVATAVFQGRRLALTIQKQNNVFAQQFEWLGSRLQRGHGHDGVPEFAKNGLLRDQHEAFLLKRKWTRAIPDRTIPNSG